MALVSGRGGFLSDDLFRGSAGETEKEKEKTSLGHGGMQHWDEHIPDAFIPAEKQISDLDSGCVPR